MKTVLFRVGLALVLSNSCLLAQTTARQGDPASQIDKTEFRSPMIVETAFLAADRGLWRYGWFATSADSQLATYSCENIRISKIEFRAKDVAGGRVRVTVRPTLVSRGGHDKFVKLAFRVMNGDKRAAEAALGPISVEEGKVETRTVEVLVSSDDLKMEPITKLEITMTAWDD